MPRRKQNVDAYGKSWSPVDIPNLEKAIKLYERLNYLQDHFANSLSGSSKIMAQINEQTEIKKELEKMNIKLTEEQIKKVLELFKVRQQENDLASRTGYSAIPQSNRLINRAQSITNNNGQTTFSLNNAGSFIAGAAQQRYAQRQLNDNFKYFQDIARQIGRNPNSQLTSKLAENKTVNELSKSAGKFNFAADIIQVAANTFSKAVGTFSGLFFKGLNKQANVYEDTFTNISVRTGTTKSQYFQNQTSTASNLYSSGLAGNIATSEVQEMWNKLANNGVNQEKMFTNALEDVLTNKIVPYLDTSTAYYQQIIDQQPQFNKQIRGIGTATQEVAGSSVFINKYLQEMVDSLSPMAALAENELGVQYAQMSGAYESLRAQGLSDAAIGEMYKASASVYRDPLAALRSGNLDAQLAVVNGMANGIDFRDASQVNNSYMSAANFVSNLTPEGKWSPIYAGITNTSLGVMSKTELNERNLNITKAIEDGVKVANKTPSAAEQKTSDYTNNVNNTLKQIQENELENASTWLAKIYESLGYWGDIIAVLLKGIGAVIGAKIIGGIGKKILGIGGKAGGTSLLTNAGNVMFDAGMAAGYGGNSVGGAIATGIGTTLGAATLVAGGTALGVGGINDAVKDFSSGNTGRGVADVVQAGAGIGAAGVAVGSGIAAAAGGAGLGGAIAAAATNPVGWALLAVGAVVLAGKGIADTIDYVNKSFDATAKSQEQLNQMERKWTEESKKQLEPLENYGTLISQTNDLETAKQLVVEAGIKSQTELDDLLVGSEEDQLEALKDLTEQFIESKRKLSEDEVGLKTSIAGANQGQKTNLANFMSAIMDKGSVNDLTDAEKKLLNAYGQEVIEYVNELKQAGTLDDDSNKHWKYLYDQGVTDSSRYNFYDDNFSSEDYWVLTHAGFDADRRTQMQELLTNSTTEGHYYDIVSKGNGNLFTGAEYRTIDAETAASYVSSILEAAAKDDKETAEKYIKKLKLGGYNSLDDFGTKAENKLKEAMDTLGIKSYRSGLPYVPYDDYLANLHEGEAVITAATANELRNLITTYRNSMQTNVNFEAAIQNQTTVLVNKLNEVISTIEQINSPFGSSSNIVSEMSKSMSILDNMKYMRSTKSFN